MRNFFLFLVIPFLVFSFSGCTQKEAIAPTEDDSAIIFFYGEECPHCKIVEKFVAENGIRDKVQFSEREIYHNKANGALFTQKARQCQIPEENWGVPMLWSEGKCWSGDKDIISFFQEKINEKK